MKTSAILPVGTRTNQEDILISQGDILKLATGDEVTFLEMKRTKFIAKINGRNMNVPVYRDRMDTPFILKVVGEDKSVITKKSDINKFEPGELFALESRKETFMFVKNESGKNIAMDLATGKRFKIGTDFEVIKVDVDERRKELFDLGFKLALK